MVRHSRALVAGTLRALGPPPGHRHGRRDRRRAGQDPPRAASHVGRRRPGSGSRRSTTAPSMPRRCGSCCCATGGGPGCPSTRSPISCPPSTPRSAGCDQTVDRSPDGLLRYVNESQRGLANHGWKDSGDAMRHADGSIAPPPIALLEAQAYAVEAALAAAEHRCCVRARCDRLAALGRRPGRAASAIGSGWVTATTPTWRWRSTARDDPSAGWAATWVTPSGPACSRPAESARVVARLLRPDMLRDFGIGTLSSENPGYNPIGYHTGSVWAHDTAIVAAGMARAGFADEAAVVAERLLRLGVASGYRLPELCGGEAVGRRPVPVPGRLPAAGLGGGGGGGRARHPRLTRRLSWCAAERDHGEGVMEGTDPRGGVRTRRVRGDHGAGDGGRPRHRAGDRRSASPSSAPTSCWPATSPTSCRPSATRSRRSGASASRSTSTSATSRPSRRSATPRSSASASVDFVINNAGGQFQAHPFAISDNGWRAVDRPQPATAPGTCAAASCRT